MYLHSLVGKKLSVGLPNGDDKGKKSLHSLSQVYQILNGHCQAIRFHPSHQTIRNWDHWEGEMRFWRNILSLR